MYSKKLDRFLKDVANQCERLSFELNTKTREENIDTLCNLASEAQNFLDDKLYSDVVETFTPILDSEYMSAEYNREVLKDCTPKKLLQFFSDNEYDEVADWVYDNIGKIEEISEAVCNYIEVLEDDAAEYEIDKANAIVNGMK